MAYKRAKECFNENLQMIGDPATKPYEWNLNSGLLALSNGIETDLSEIKASLRQILLEARKRP